MSDTNPLRADLNHVLEHTRDFWGELRGERVFITGGTGFFGCWLLESLLWANRKLGLASQAVVLTREPEAFRKKAAHLANDPAVTLVRGDVRTFEFPEGRFSHVIHAATETNAEADGRIEPLEQFCANADGTRRVLEFAKQAQAQRLLFTSSGAVYGKQPPGMTHVPEDYMGAPDTMEPGTAYGQSKRASEFLFAAESPSALEVKIARCFAFVGPGLPLDSNYAIGNFIRDALKRGPIIVKGDGTPFRSYLYAADLAIWLWTILFRGASRRPYNVGSEEDLSIAELAERVARCFTPKPEVRILGAATPGKPPEMYVPSTKRAREELGLLTTLSLDMAIQRTADWPVVAFDHS